MSGPGQLLARARAAHPALDHLVRAVARYQSDSGDRLAASVTYFWFLSLFPILLLAASALGYVLGDQAQHRVDQTLAGYLPGGLVEKIGSTLENAKGRAGLIGVLGLLYAGLGWVGALRLAIRSMWHQNVLAGNVLRTKLFDVGALIGLGVTIGGSVFTSGVLAGFTDVALHALGMRDSIAGAVLVQLLGLALTFAADVLLFLYLFGRLSRVATPWRRLVRGAVLGSVGLEVLKRLGGLYVAYTTEKGSAFVATYGAFAVTVGVLVFLNLMSRLLLLTAAWTVTAPYDSDVSPSGTASRALARAAGMPEHFATDDPDRPARMQQDGAPTPLVAALRSDPGEVLSSPAVPALAVSSPPARRLPARAGGAMLLAVAGLWAIRARRPGRR